jgi:YD repeat-containing protein
VQLTYRNDRLATVQDGAGRSLTFTYNARGKITAIRDPLGRTLQYRYAERGDLSASTDLSRHETQYAYDTQRDMIISEHGPGSRLTSYQYLISSATPDQYSVVVIDGLGRQTAHAFSNMPDGMTLATPTPSAARPQKPTMSAGTS